LPHLSSISPQVLAPNPNNSEEIGCQLLESAESEELLDSDRGFHAIQMPVAPWEKPISESSSKRSRSKRSRSSRSKSSHKSKSSAASTEESPRWLAWKKKATALIPLVHGGEEENPIAVQAKKDFEEKLPPLSKIKGFTGAWIDEPRWGQEFVKPGKKPHHCSFPKWDKKMKAYIFRSGAIFQPKSALRSVPESALTHTADNSIALVSTSDGADPFDYNALPSDVQNWLTAQVNRILAADESGGADIHERTVLLGSGQIEFVYAEGVHESGEKEGDFAFSKRGEVENFRTIDLKHLRWAKGEYLRALRTLEAEMDAKSVDDWKLIEKRVVDEMKEENEE
jgi:hypothetical protein